MAQHGQTYRRRSSRNCSTRFVKPRRSEKLSDQVAEKLLELFKEKANPTTKEVTYDEFICLIWRK
jgi:trigger factor